MAPAGTVSGSVRGCAAPAWPLEWPPRGLTAAAQGKLRKPRACRHTCDAHAHAHVHIRARDGAQA
eukprot:14501922-Alexandrium_andersonii.AAC.1